MSNESRPVVFVDRDNTLIADPGYLRDPEQVRILPGVPDALKRLRDAGFAVVIVTNQSGVARGYFTEDELRTVHERLQEMLSSKGAAVDAIYYCPYLPGREAVVDAYRADSDLRKPNPGMILKAAREMSLDLSRSWMIGDSTRDVQAGSAAGCRTILLGSGATDPEARPDHTMPDFPAAADFVLREHKRMAEIRTVLDASRRGGERATVPAAAPVQRGVVASAMAATTVAKSGESKPNETKPVERTKSGVDAPRVDSVTEQKPMTQISATAEPKKPVPRAVEPATAAPSTRADDSGDSPIDVLDQILEEVRAMRRQRQFADFSFAQLAGAVAQAFALCAIGFGLYSMVNDAPNRALVSMVTGIAFQLMALTGFVITRRR